MPIPFSSIPVHIRIFIIQKLTIYDFLRFHRSSREACNISKSVKTRFTVHRGTLYTDCSDEGLKIRITYSYSMNSDDVIDLPLRFQTVRISISEPLTNEDCDQIINFLSKTDSGCYSVSTDTIKCKPMQFNNLMEASKSQAFLSMYKIGSEYLKVPAMKNMENLCVRCVLNDDDLLSLQIPQMTLVCTKISSKGVNLLLHEWLAGIREIVRIEINSSQEILKDATLHGIPYSVCEDLDSGEDMYKIKNTRNQEIYVIFDNRFVNVIIRNSVSP